MSWENRAVRVPIRPQMPGMLHLYLADDNHCMLCSQDAIQPWDSISNVLPPPSVIQVLDSSLAIRV
eukprot:211489-Pleurochrysis_carterae.AAC.1